MKARVRLEAGARAVRGKEKEMTIIREVGVVRKVRTHGRMKSCPPGIAAEEATVECLAMF